MTHQLLTLPKQTNIDSSVRVVPGAKASFFLTGTTTPQDTYTTSARNVAHTNPVVADANGVLPAIYLDPTIQYKLTLTTSADVLIYTVDPVNDQVLSQSVIGAYLYPQTAAELAAGVTPTNYAYPPGDVRRYGVDADGTDQTSEIVDALTDLGIDYDGPLTVPANIKFDMQAVLNAMPDKSVLLFENVHQSGPSGYRQQIVGMMSKAPDAGTDSTLAVVDPHNVSVGLINPRTAGTTSGDNGLATIGWYRGFYTLGTKGPRNQLQAQFGKSPVRLAQGVGCFTLAMLAPERAGNYEVWETGWAVTSGQYCVANGYYYRATTTGTTGATEPTHTTGSVSDGGVTWAYESTSFFTTFYSDEQRRIGTAAVDVDVTHNWDQGPEDTEDFVVRYRTNGTSKTIYFNFLPTDGAGAYSTTMPFMRMTHAQGVLWTAPGFARNLMTITATAVTLNNGCFESDTAANFAAIGNAVNTANKFAGKIMRDSTNNKLVMAAGSTAAAVWSNIADGTTVYTPV
jgi:hypothetical protein